MLFIIRREPKSERAAKKLVRCQNQGGSLGGPEREALLLLKPTVSGCSAKGGEIMQAKLRRKLKVKVCVTYLLCDYGEYGQLDAVELVEATPQPSLTQPLENLGHVGVPLLIGAVRHHLREATRIVASQNSNTRYADSTFGVRGI